MALTTIPVELVTLDDGVTISTTDNSDNLTLTSTDADSNSGPNLRLYRNSGSPADSDTLGVIEFEGRNDNSQDVVYAAIDSRIVDASDGTEDGRIEIVAALAGTDSTSRILMNSTEAVVNDDSADLDFRVESDNDANALFVQGSDGAVGIGTSSPASYYTNTLHLYGSASAAIKISNSDTGSSDGDGVDLALDDSEEFRIIQRENAAMSFWTNATLAQKIDANGHITMPLQPAFQAYAGSAQSNIAVAAWTDIVFGSTAFDQNSDYASNTFTAPVTGKYQISWHLRMEQIDVDQAYFQIQIWTSNRNYLYTVDPGTHDEDAAYHSYAASVLADMDASDTAKIQIYFAAGTAVQVDVASESFFSGFLAC